MSCKALRKEPMFLMDPVEPVHHDRPQMKKSHSVIAGSRFRGWFFERGRRGKMLPCEYSLHPISQRSLEGPFFHIKNHKLPFLQELEKNDLPETIQSQGIWGFVQRKLKILSTFHSSIQSGVYTEDVKMKKLVLQIWGRKWGEIGMESICRKGNT